MSAADEDRDRQVIPRWRDLIATAEHGELGNGRRVKAEQRKDDLDGLERRLDDFRARRSLSFAADLVNASIVLGPTAETSRAAEIVVADPRSPAMAVDTARWLLTRAGEIHEPAELTTLKPHETRQRDIAGLRRGLRANPRNALRWVELSRNYINEGHDRKATTTMRIAVNMAPFDRYVLRCAVRLWTHLADPEQAIRTLAHAGKLVIEDPWLLASEIAASDLGDRPSRNIRRGREMLDRARHAPFALSELTSALATIEMQAGDVRRARKLFHSALVDPNENSVAQAEWASPRLGGLELDDDRLSQSAEARARRLAQTDQINLTLDAAWEWLGDQPFSTHPAVFGSYQAAMYRRFDDGARMAREGLRANPRDPIILNNLAFCEASLGNIDAAAKALAEVPHESQTLPSVTATRGLVSFRAGDPEMGRRLYEEAMAAMSNPVDILRAKVMLISEEMAISVAPTDPRVAMLIDEVEGASDRQLLIWLRYVSDARRQRQQDDRRSRRAPR
jgi:tetratricopeptide (TPR) repeat protein